MLIKEKEGYYNSPQFSYLWRRNFLHNSQNLSMSYSVQNYVLGFGSRLVTYHLSWINTKHFLVFVLLLNLPNQLLWEQ
jgi:hypothetical protein